MLKMSGTIAGGMTVSKFGPILQSQRDKRISGTLKDQAFSKPVVGADLGLKQKREINLTEMLEKTSLLCCQSACQDLDERPIIKTRV